MAILGTLLKKGIILRESLEQQYTSPFDLQKQELRKLLIHSQHTEFGKYFRFHELLRFFKKQNGDQFYQEFKSRIPVYDYDRMYDEWWHLSKEGRKNISYPGKVKYFALSSGTSGASSKYIPVTKDMIKSIRKTSVRQILTLSKYDLPDDLFTKGILMLGGSTNLRKSGTYFEGDLSGITASQIPFWFQHFYKPGKKIAKTSEWGAKLDEITKKAKDWDIGIIVGVPAWLQILMEKIVNHYQVKSIHDIWPNLKIFVHGGVSFEPYKKGFERLLKHPLVYMETYLASEGFIAFQYTPGKKSMKLVLNNGIFYEFVPFTDANFTDEGALRENPETLQINDVEAGKEYALLLSTNAGAWRYLIGDVVKFASVEEAEIVITGRTKHFLSLCGEHLSLDNMNKAVELVGDQLNIDIREFTVLGEASGNLFAHNWFIGTDDPVDESVLRKQLDEALMALNDDYKVERGHALKEMNVHVLPTSIFYNWLKKQGKEGGQNKFPRVLKKAKAEDWKSFLADQKLTISS
ncbi:GH3 family domain-containing protein [Marinoscillum furvescens]|uniref:GH3 auxin-responsive promoter n=1 Tax=Marinoscillum furvescens DSM 4134 TaxID=1122208 RepID=A0A3D9L3F5_MARFU|nr:GH3 auxin-responsive promoter family protein [Marinoscillum furvescens]RED97511.1 GH3 auxin-responsive promoter [Marinoscillum furvescens DSM 4134]